MLKLRVFRPFPAEEIAAALANVKAVAVMDRADSFSNQGGPLGAEVMGALFRARSQAYAINIVYGLGGRDVRVEHMEDVYAELERIAETGEVGDTYRYMGVREQA
jgi:pyruvate ferredoxin oxidoreductase alpha subunit